MASPQGSPARRLISGAAGRAWLPAAVVGIVFLISHLPLLSRTPADLDGVNFALGVRQFDIARHQPHPPGYPLLIVLGRATASALSPFTHSFSVSPESLEIETQGLAIWSATAGAFTAMVLFDLFCSLGVRRRTALAAAAVTLCCPAYWFMGLQPMSDLPGLAISLSAVALALRAVGSGSAGQSVRRTHALAAGAITLTALAPGLRSQMFWIASPAVFAAMVVLQRQRRAPPAWLVLTAAAAGTVAWIVPLLTLSGVTAYRDALWLQATADFAHASMLATQFSLSALATAIGNTLVKPWASPWLAAVVLAAAAAGAFTLRTRRQTAGWLGLLVLAYTPFHLAFHETSHVRYALPLVPAVALLAAVGVERLFGRAAILGWAGLALGSLTIVVPATVAQAGTRAPAFEAAEDLRGALRAAIDPPRLAMHESVRLALRGYKFTQSAVASDAGSEVLDLASDLEAEPDRPIWFLANARRTDLTMIDPASGTLFKRYRWPFRPDRLLSGARPLGVDWYKFRAPGWLLLQGWAVTPEVGGRTRARAAADDRLHPEAMVRRRRRPVTMMIGGRFVGDSCGDSPTLVVSIDGIEQARHRLSLEPTFLVLHQLDPVSTDPGSRRWARLGLALERWDGASCTNGAKFDQFDAISGRQSALGLGAGWHEAEQVVESGELWRWMGASADLVVLGAARGVQLHLSGDMPERIYPEPPMLSILAGEKELLRTVVNGEFSLEVALDPRDLQAAGGRLTITSSQSFVPAETGWSGDRRRLSVRIRDVHLRPMGRPGRGSADASDPGGLPR